MAKYFFSGLILFLCLGCANNKKENHNFITKNVKFKSLGLKKDELMKPWAMALFDSIMLVADQYDGKGISVIDLKKKQLIRRIIPIGRGPNEVLSSFRTTKIANKRFQIQTPNLKKVLVFSIDSINNAVINPVNTVYFKDIPLKKEEAIFKLYQINDSIYTALGAFEKSKHLIINKNSKSHNKLELSYKYDYPLIDQKEYNNASNFSKYWILSGYISISPNHKHMAFSSYYCFYYRTFDIAQNTIKKTYERIDYLPEYRICIDNSPAFSKKSKRGFNSPYATNDALYLLYMTRTRIEYGSNCQYTRELYRIGWDGEIKQKFILDRDTDYIAVDEKNKRIYATCLNSQTNYIELGYYDF